MVKKVKHVFFDLDRTLWDFDTNSKATLHALHSEYLADFNFGFDDFFDVYQTVNHQLWADYNAKKIDKTHLRSHRFLNTLLQFEIHNPELSQHLEHEYIETTPNRTQLIAGSIEVLEYLKGNYELHIITNGFDEVQHRKINQSGLSPFFTHIVTSDQIKINKPDPAIFRHALDLAQAHTSESVMIGDDLHNDVLPALELGMQAIWLSDGDKNKMGNEFSSITHLSELKSLL